MQPLELSAEQKKPIDSTTTHRLLFAGPGTGKSFTILGLIEDLIQKKDVSPPSILVLTFTRAATKELREKIQDLLGRKDNLPRVSTLHAYALRQLMKNVSHISSLPGNFTIANDFEERHLIMEDIKTLISSDNIREIKSLFHRLSANWETLRIEEGDWEVDFDHPEFIGAWQEHRRVYGYMLRSELVYQLKKAIGEDPKFELEGPTEFVIVDEYQDFNRCDLAIIGQLRAKEARVFAAGDDDQSIYQFRFAHPDGIRQFCSEVADSEMFTISECRRCDQQILKLADAIIRQDAQRVPKTLQSVTGNSGEYRLLRFNNQYEEAAKIAEITKNLIDVHGVPANEIIVLLRSDRNKLFSENLINFFSNLDVPMNVEVDDISEYEENWGRFFLSLVRLLQNPSNDLALRTILELTPGLGPATFLSVYDEAKVRKERFSEIMEKVLAGEITTIKNQKRLLTTIQGIRLGLAGFEGETEINDILPALADLIPDRPEDFIQRMQRVIDNNELKKLSDLIQYADELLNPVKGAPDEAIDGVRIMTMHQAKGLSAQVVFIVAAENEYSPGRGDVDEERRLFYVSVTRARHRLYLTYCNERVDGQAFTGNVEAGQRQRTLSQYLSELPIISPEDGNAFVAN